VVRHLAHNMCLAEYEVKRQKEWGNDVLTTQPMDRPGKPIVDPMDPMDWPGWAGQWIGWMTTERCGKMRDDTHWGDTPQRDTHWGEDTPQRDTHWGEDTRTHILHFKENALLSSAFVCATKKNQNEIVCTCLCDECTNKQTR